MYYVYRIKVDGVTRYIGITNNPVRRQKEHRRDYEKGDAKYLYRMTREVSPETRYELEIVKEFDLLIDAKRWECFLILKDWFSKRQLWQSQPISIKYY
jgi:predicted GIY-YIG superfamily endonuclease